MGGFRLDVLRIFYAVNDHTESLAMKKHIISVSKHDLTRCSSCNQHHHIDRSLDDQALLALTCGFCGGRLIGASQSKGMAHFAASRTSKLAMGLLGASLTFTACKDDEVVENPTGGVMMSQEVERRCPSGLSGGAVVGVRGRRGDEGWEDQGVGGGVGDDEE